MTFESSIFRDGSATATDVLGLQPPCLRAPRSINGREDKDS